MNGTHNDYDSKTVICVSCKKETQVMFYRNSGRAACDRGCNGTMCLKCCMENFEIGK